MEVRTPRTAARRRPPYTDEQQRQPRPSHDDIVQYHDDDSEALASIGFQTQAQLPAQSQHWQADLIPPYTSGPSEKDTTPAQPFSEIVKTDPLRESNAAGNGEGTGQLEADASDSVPELTRIGSRRAISLQGVPGGTEQHRVDHWSILAETVWERTRVDIDRWWNEITSLLTFAGLFSAVVTGFGALAYTVFANPSPAPTAPVLHRYVVALWFASLVCGLGAAAVAMSVNQWLNYLLTPAGLVEFGPRQKLRIWNLRRATFQRWRVDLMLGIPPVLLQIAVSLFLAALVGCLWPLSLAVSLPSLILATLVLLFQVTTLIAPAVVIYSPFQSPQAQWGRWVWVHVLYAIALFVHAVASTMLGSRPSRKKPVPAVTLATPKEGNPTSRMAEIRRIPARVSRLAHWHRRPKIAVQTRMEFLEQSIYYLHELCKHCNWVMNEKLYLDDAAHTAEIDSTLFAATFAATVTKDDKSTLGYIQSCLHDLPVDLACSNASALLVECDNARLDNAIRAEAGDASSVWQYDSLDTRVTAMMADIIVDVTERLIDWRHPEHVPPAEVEQELVDMIDRLDDLLHFLPRDAWALYHRLLHLLRDKTGVGSIEKRARKHILAALWKHVAYFDFKDVNYIKEVLKQVHGQEEDYAMKLELLLLALHIHVDRKEQVDDVLTLLDAFLQSSPKDEFIAAQTAEGSHVQILLCDLELCAPASANSPPADLVGSVLLRLSSFIGDYEFHSHNPVTGKMTKTCLSRVLNMVNQRTGSMKCEPISCTHDKGNQQLLSSGSAKGRNAVQPQAQEEGVNRDGRRLLPWLSQRRAGITGRAHDEENLSVGDTWSRGPSEKGADSDVPRKGVSAAALPQNA